MPKVTAVGDLTPVQRRQLAYDLAELLYQARRRTRAGGRSAPPCPSP